MKRLLFLILFLIVLAPLRAQDESYSVDPVPDVEALMAPLTPLPPPLSKPGDLLTLAQCLDIARDNHPALAASWAMVLQSQASLQQVWALYYPTLSFSFLEDIREPFGLGRAGALAQNFGISVVPTSTLSLTHTVFDGGSRHSKVEAARQTLRARFFDYETAWITQAQSVQSAYLEVVKQEHLLMISLLDFKRAYTNRNDANRFLKAGTKSLIDLTQAEIQLAQAENDLALQRNSHRDAWIKLAQSMGVSSAEIQERSLEPILDLSVELPLYEEALEELDTHPQYLSFRAQELSGIASVAGERKSMRPNLGLTNNLQSLRQGGLNGGLWEVQLTLTVPLYDPNVRPSMELFEAQALEAREQARNTRLQLVQSLELAYSGSRGAEERSEAALRQTKAALLNYDLAVKRYRAGLNDYTELVNAVSFVSDAQRSYVQALADERNAEINLVQATGLASKSIKDYFRTKAGQEMLRDLKEDFPSPTEPTTEAPDGELPSQE